MQRTHNITYERSARFRWLLCTRAEFLQSLQSTYDNRLNIVEIVET